MEHIANFIGEASGETLKKEWGLVKFACDFYHLPFYYLLPATDQLALHLQSGDHGLISGIEPLN